MMADPLLAQSAMDRLQSAAYEFVVEVESYDNGRNLGTSRPIRLRRIDRQPPHRSLSPHGRRPETPGPTLMANGWSHPPGRRHAYPFISKICRCP
jgi:hypothetical protein